MQHQSFPAKIINHVSGIRWIDNILGLYESTPNLRKLINVFNHVTNYTGKRVDVCYLVIGVVINSKNNTLMISDYLALKSMTHYGCRQTDRSILFIEVAECEQQDANND